MSEETSEEVNATIEATCEAVRHQLNRCYLDDAVRLIEALSRLLEAKANVDYLEKNKEKR